MSKVLGEFDMKTTKKIIKTSKEKNEFYCCQYLDPFKFLS